jgi:glyoxylase-like metal-dependent hydrolase (beta-lactamase superfamily II)
MYNLYTIRLENEKFINYCYLGINDYESVAFVIDPAWDISEIINILNSSGAKLEYILITHSHYDHMNKAIDLSKATGASICISKREYNYYNLTLPSVRLLEDNQKILFGNNMINAFLTPGHTKGSMCYKIGNNFFTGDTLFIEGCGICSGEGGSPEEMYQSLGILRKMIKAEDCIYPGHAFYSPVGQKGTCLEGNIYMNIHDLDDFIYIRMREDNKIIYAFI